MKLNEPSVSSDLNQMGRCNTNSDYTGDAVNSLFLSSYYGSRDKAMDRVATVLSLKCWASSSRNQVRNSLIQLANPLCLHQLQSSDCYLLVVSSFESGLPGTITFLWLFHFYETSSHGAMGKVTLRHFFKML